MDKKKPSFSLKKFKELFRNAKTREVTKVSTKGAASLGYMDINEIMDVIDNLDKRDFYKSMSSTVDSNIWQDVYKTNDQDNKIYIKLQMSIDKKKAILVQFKENTEDI